MHIEPKKAIHWDLLRGRITVPDDIDVNDILIERIFQGDADWTEVPEAP